VEIFGERPTVERTLRAVDGGQRYTTLSMFTIFSLFLSLLPSVLARRVTLLDSPSTPPTLEKSESESEKSAPKSGESGARRGTRWAVSV